MPKVPFRFNGLYAIGVVFMILNLVFFVVIWAMMFCRFYWYPYMFKLSFRHPTESLFVPAVAVSFGTILINIVEYGSDKVGRWLNRAILGLFWFDSGLAVTLSITIYLILWSTQTYTIARMTPIWIFPAYPLLIIGPHAAALAQEMVNPREALAVIIGGFTIQGIGFLVSVTVYSAFVYRLMTHKLPAESLRPGMFVSVGPSAFTASGVIGMASNLDTILSNWPGGSYMGMDPRLAANILTIVANWVSLWLWGLAIWFFFVSLVANLVCLRKPGSLPFAMTWFSFIFPQTALTKATFRVAAAFDAFPLQVVGCVMTATLILVWFLVVGKMVHAIYKKQVLWPETGEDKTEGGFSMPKDHDEKVVLGDVVSTSTDVGSGRTKSR
jgi:C4-dicarboxylate transporter/malic acid transport protein